MKITLSWMLGAMLPFFVAAFCSFFLTITLFTTNPISAEETASLKTKTTMSENKKIIPPEQFSLDHEMPTQIAENWDIKWVQPVSEIKSTAYMYQHKKTGAPLLFLQSDDDNKVFCISFRTPPTDSTGIAHIMEHSVLCGSEKFPSKEPFVDLLKGSLQTFLNAFTADDRTMYPVASRNDKDFNNLMNVYLDAVFFPKAAKTPEILMQEGWHYQVDPETGELKYNGIVFNEMKGVYSSPQSILYRTIQKSMYPDSTYTNDSGGNPDAIPNLTFEQFKQFHDKFYHPSNSMIYLYGNGDIWKHLEFIDKEYLSRFDKLDVDAKVIPQPAFSEPKKIIAEYSIDQDDSTDDKTFLSMNYLLTESLDDVELHYGMDLLSYILVGSEAAPLKRALLDAGIGLDIQCFFDSSILQPCFSIVVKSSNPQKQEEFEKILDETLRKIVKDGIDRKLIEGAINRTEFVLREFQVSGYPKGLALNMQMLETWTYGGNPLQKLQFETTLQNIRNEVEHGFFEKLIQHHLLDNKSRGSVMLKPKQGLEKERTEKSSAALAEIKKSLSAEELEAIKQKQEALVQRQAAPDNPEDVAKIPTLEISDINVEAETIPSKRDEKEKGIINVTVPTNKVVYITAYFDALKEPLSEKGFYLSILADLLGRLDTNNYKYGDLNTEIDLHTGGIATGLSLYNLLHDENKGQNTKFDARFIAKTKVMLPKLEKGLELVSEMLTKTKFDDLPRIKEIIQELRVGIEQGLMSAGNRFGQTRAGAYFSPLSAFKDEIGGIEYYKKLVDLEKNFDEKGPKLVEELKKLTTELFQGTTPLVVVTLDEEDFETAKPALEQFEMSFESPKKSEKSAESETQFPVLGQLNEAVIIPSRVQYVVKSADYKKAGFDYSGKMLVLMNILRTGYLWNNVRVQGGAYGGGLSIERSGLFSLWSFRDPHLKRTVDVFDGIADYLENIEISEEELTKAIIATIGSLDKPMTPSEKGSRIAAMQISGLTQEDIQRERQEVLSTTVHDLRNFAKMFRSGKEQNNICVFGNEQKLESDKDLFKTSIRPIE
ncbi:MAG: insulinase family protein [Thermoguttaceae bacterium]